LPSDKPQAASDMTILWVAGGNPLLQGHFTHLCHIQILPSLSPDKTKSVSFLTDIVRLPWR
jgi:hypothetical protein